MNGNFTEQSISQMPALHLLANLGWTYLAPREASAHRGDNTANVLLESILKKQISKINHIGYKQQRYDFTEENIHRAIRKLKELPIQDGFIGANKAFYERITLGTSLEQRIDGDKRSFHFQYIDWKNPENNSYHITEEYTVARQGGKSHYRPDLVLFVNGIPMVIIECKNAANKKPIEEAIEQHLRNQQRDGIRNLYHYSNVLIALAGNQAKYATTATPASFWSLWKEQFQDENEQEAHEKKLYELKNQQPNNEALNERLDDFTPSATNTEQDRLLFALCRPKRLFTLIRDFILYDSGHKKITRYQQFFAVQNTLKKLTTRNAKGNYQGGVIWHTQGSGKSLTMAILAQRIASQRHINDAKIILVTDRVDLDAQITNTFRKCDIEVKRATTGTNLLTLIGEPNGAVITTVVNKFENALKKTKQVFDSKEIFVLIDEGHRSQYGIFNVSMRGLFPNACFIAFTGTPLLKKDKNTADRFGGLIDIYSINDAVADGAVVPLLYEGRHIDTDVNAKALDAFFDKICEDASDYGKAKLKAKFSTKDKLNEAEQLIIGRAWDISDHFASHIQGMRFGNLKAKGQLVAPNKMTAIKYRNALKTIGKINCEVLISAPDMREGESDAFEVNPDNVVKQFWEEMMDKYGNDKAYEKSLIKAFKNGDDLEIIIVVDKLLTGFDAPSNYVMYLVRALKNHTLLQAIARVNRLAEGKEHGLIIDYYGNLENLNKAIDDYSGTDGSVFDPNDIRGTATNIAVEIAKLPKAHNDLWDLFKTKPKRDMPAYEELLADEALRNTFYDKLSYYARLLKLALASYDFVNKTPESKITTYKDDVKFFLKLRRSVLIRYIDEMDVSEYESQIQKLIDTHITTDGEVLNLTGKVDLFNKKEREAMLEELVGKSAKANRIAHLIIRAINIKMDEDPIFFKKLSALIQQTIKDYRQQRISELEYLNMMRRYDAQFFNAQQEDIPPALQGNKAGTAFFNLVKDPTGLGVAMDDALTTKITLEMLKKVQAIIYQDEQLIVEWQEKENILNDIRGTIDDHVFDLNEAHQLHLSEAQIDLFLESFLKIAKSNFV